MHAAVDAHDFLHGIAGRLNQLIYFFSNYTEQHWYEKGINSDALWVTPIYLPATEIFDENPQIVDILSLSNTTLLQNINAGEASSLQTHGPT